MMPASDACVQEIVVRCNNLKMNQQLLVVGKPSALGDAAELIQHMAVKHVTAVIAWNP